MREAASHGASVIAFPEAFVPARMKGKRQALSAVFGPDGRAISELIDEEGMGTVPSETPPPAAAIDEPCAVTRSPR